MEPAELSFTLAPSLPDAFLRPGYRLGFTNLPYRGVRLELAYEITPTRMEAVVQCVGADAVGIARDGDDQILPVEPPGPGSPARFPIVNGTAVRIMLRRSA